MSRKQILHNSMWGNLNVLFRYALSFVAVTIIARNYGPSDFGVYQLALTYVGILEGINLINPLFLRNYLIAHPENEKFVIYSSIINNLFIIFVTLVFLSWMWWFENDQGLLIVLVLSSLRLIIKFFDYTQLLIDARLRADVVQKIQIVSVGSFNIARILCSLSSLSINSVAGSSIFQGIASSAYGLWQAKKLKIPVWGAFQKHFFWMLFRESLPLTITAILGVLQLRIFGILVAGKMSIEAYGSLQLVLKLLEPVTAIGTIIIGANYTILAKTFNEHRSLFNKRFMKISLLTVGSSLLLSAAVLVFPKEYLYRIFGKEFELGLQFLYLGPAIVFANVFFALSIQYDTLTQRYSLTVVKYFITIVGYLVMYYAYQSIDIFVGLMGNIIIPSLVVIVVAPLYFSKWFLPKIKNT